MPDQDPRAPVDHLFLLIGGNPLPNAVAAATLLRPGGTIVPIYTPDDLPAEERIPGTEQVKKRLGRVLERYFQRCGQNDASWSDASCHYLSGIPVDPTNAYDINKKVIAYLENLEAGTRIGLHYTGGTKAMAVHAHRAARAFDERVQLSYLDSRSLRIYFDTNPDSQTHRPFRYVGEQPELSLPELIHLHGWRYTNGIQPLSAQPLAWVDLSQVLREINQDQDHPALTAYLTWKRRAWHEDDNWKKKRYRAVGSKNLPFPPGAAQNIAAAIRRAFGLSDDATTFNVRAAATAFGFRDIKDFLRWLDGSWLESQVFEALLQLRDKLGLHDLAMNVKLEERTGSAGTDFEFDVVAMRGYQLFAFSCTTDAGKAKQKLKLFELYMRARQFGGDEACMALVCTSNKPETVEAEAQRDIGASRIAVFGRDHLKNLPYAIGNWIRQHIGRPE